MSYTQCASCKTIVTKIVTKHVVPDVLAINSWLNNRMRDQWSYRPKPSTGFNDDQLTKVKALIG